jgi:UDP-N-acetylglucosamine/UDP-N-acetylgalactosamine diphosphorylase
MIDDEILAQQRALLKRRPGSLSLPFHPVAEFATKGDSDVGEELLARGKVAAIMVAGGQGTRLGHEGPKGTYPVSVVRSKTLFEIFAEKVAAASRKYGQTLPLAIMTSAINHLDTTAYFEKNRYFGLKPGQISFFTQGTLPFLDRDGNPFLEEADRIATGPDGNGGVFHQLFASAIGQQWLKAGIEWVNFFFVDNPLSDPFDSALTGFGAAQKSEVAIKAITRVDSNEKVGLFVRQEGKIRVIEYTEFPQEEWNARNGQGHFRYNLANIGSYSFYLPFLQNLFQTVDLKDLPLHYVWKKARYFDLEAGVSRLPQEPNAYKFERYVFDILNYTTRTSLLVAPRASCYAPLKNSSGEHNIDAVREALQRLDRETYLRLTGRQAPEVSFELAQDFHYPTAALVQKWSGRMLPRAGYIDTRIE